MSRERQLQEIRDQQQKQINELVSGLPDPSALVKGAGYFHNDREAREELTKLRPVITMIVEALAAHEDVFRDYIIPLPERLNDQLTAVMQEYYEPLRDDVEELQTQAQEIRDMLEVIASEQGDTKKVAQEALDRAKHWEESIRNASAKMERAWRGLT